MHIGAWNPTITDGGQIRDPDPFWWLVGWLLGSHWCLFDQHHNCGAALRCETRIHMKREREPDRGDGVTSYRIKYLRTGTTPHQTRQKYWYKILFEFYDVKPPRY